MPPPDYIQRPLIPLGVSAFAGGLAGGVWACPVCPTLAAGLVLSGAACVLRRGRASLPLLIAAAFAVYAGLAAQARRPAPDDLGLWTPRAQVLLAGTLSAFPQPSTTGRGWVAEVACHAAVRERRWTPVGGSVRVFVNAPVPAWDPGDEVLLAGKLEPVAGPLNPAELDYAEFLARQGVRARLTVRGRADAVRSGRTPPASWGALAGVLHRRIERAMTDGIGAPAAGLALSLVLGDRSGLSRWRQERMAAAGLAHVLAVSGMNVSLVFFTVLGLARTVRLGPRPAILLGLGAVAAFTLAAGASPPVLRAAWMAAGLAAGHLGGRRTDPGSGLALAGLILLAQDPLAALDASFQLTFTATAAILQVWPTAPRPAALGPRAARWAADILRTTAAAWLGTAPLCLRYFYALVPAAFPTNLLAAPFVTVVTDGGLLLGALPGWVPLLPWVVARVTEWGALGLEALAVWAAACPGGRVFLWPGSAEWTLGVYAAALAARLPRTRVWGGAALAALLLAYPLQRPEAPAPGSVRATFLALGQGEATLLETAGGPPVLVDTGSASEFLWRVKPCLAARGINRLAALVVSHTDDDHAGGVPECVTVFRPRRVFLPGGADPELRARFARAGAAPETLVQGDVRDPTPDLRLEVLWPPAGQPLRHHWTMLVACLSAAGGRLLFPGDAPAAVERRLWLAAPCDVLKVGHHGSRGSSEASFLGRVSPRLAVVMPGTRNPFGFPRPETLERLWHAAGSVLDTGARGAVEVVLREDGDLSWRTWK